MTNVESSVPAQGDAAHGDAAQSTSTANHAPSTAPAHGDAAQSTSTANHAPSTRRHPRGSFLERLRAATTTAHEALDASLPLGANEVTRERYAAFLRGSLLIVEPLERALAPHGLPVDGTSRSAAIRADLAALGDASAIATAARVELPLPTVDDEAQALGVAYVMEGSSLGGLYLARAIGVSLGLEARGASGQDGLRYLALRGTKTKAVWNDFVTRLESWAARAPEDQQDRACEAAERTFEAYAAAFEAAGASRVASAR